MAATAGNAQDVPGFLGRRLSISYQPKIGISFFRASSRAIDPATNRPNTFELQADANVGVQIRHQLNVDYTLSKKSSLGLYLGYLQSPYGEGLYYNRTFSTNTENLRILEEFPLVNSLGIGFHYRSYFDFFAPLGNYIEVRAGAEFINHNGAEFTYPVPLGNSFLIQSYDVDGGSTTSFIFGLGWGNKRVISERLILGWGLEFNYLFGGEGNINYFLEGDLPSIELGPGSEAETSREDALRIHAHSRVFNQMLFSINLTVGLLN